VSVFGGSTPSPVAGQYGQLLSAANPYAGLATAQAQQLAAQLGDFGAVQGQIQQGVTAVNGLLPAAQTTIAALKAGNPIGALTDATPLLAAGLAAAGVGTVAVAAIAGAIVAFTEIASALGLFQPKPPQTCTNVVGTVCFTRARPWGTADPNWLTIEEYTSAADAGGSGWTSVSGTSCTGSTWGECAFSWWFLIGAELYALGDRSIAAANWALDYGGVGSSDAAAAAAATIGFSPAAVAQWSALGSVGADFCRTFDLAWVKQSEMYLNGYGAPDPGSFLNAFVIAWNTMHSPSRIITFDGTGVTFIDAILQGNAQTSIGGVAAQSQRYVLAMPVHIGPPLAAAGPGAPMATSKKVAIAAGVVGGATVAAAGVGTYAYYAGVSLPLLFGRAVGAVGGLFGAEAPRRRRRPR
jgi:hypothetical protein